MDTCIFCQITEKESPAYIIYEDDQSIAFLDKYPKTRGHLQLIPKTHYRWIYDIPDIGRFFTTAQTLIRDIIPRLGAHHVTLSTFGGEVAHAHLWIVPQYHGKEKELNESWGPKTTEDALQEVWIQLTSKMF